jgi:hypothetical protein
VVVCDNNNIAEFFLAAPGAEGEEVGARRSARAAAPALDATRSFEAHLDVETEHIVDVDGGRCARGAKVKTGGRNVSCYPGHKRVRVFCAQMSSQIFFFEHAPRGETFTPLLHSQPRRAPRVQGERRASIATS